MEDLSNSAQYEKLDTNYSTHFVTNLPNIKNTSSFTNVTLKAALDEIKSDKYKVKIEPLRSAYIRSIEPDVTKVEKNEAKRLYTKNKQQLPAYAFNGTFNNSVDNKSFAAASGVVIVDIDHLSDKKLTPERVISSLSADKSIVATWTSPSGDGVKVLVACPPVCDEADHKKLFAQLVVYFNNEHNLHVDQSGSDIRRLCFVSYDPDIYINYEAKIFNDEVYLPATKHLSSSSSSSNEKPSSKENIVRVQAALKFVSDYSYDAWFKVAAAIKFNFDEEGFECFHEWSKLDEKGYQGEEDCRKHYDGCRRENDDLVSCSSIFYWAKDNGWDGSIDVVTALKHIDDSDNRSEIVTQVATLRLLGLNKSYLTKLTKAIAARGKLGQVKRNTFVNEIEAEKARLFETRELPSVTKTYSLDELLPKNIFPDCSLLRTGVKIKSTYNNLRILLIAYGITCNYDVLLKDQVIVIPDISGSPTLDANANFLYVQSLLALNDIDKSTADYLPIIFRDNATNPILDWIAETPWDGNIDRLSQFYATVSVHPEYEAIKNQVLLLWMLQAVAACDNGRNSPREDKFLKFEYVLTLQGNQGVSKTTWIRKLLPKTLSPYIKTSVLLDVKNKDSIKAAVSCWICELGELDATFRRSDIAAFKAFSSSEVDEIRLPYERVPNKYERRTSLIASVNQSDYLHDPTGSRRFWTLGITALDAQHDINMQQLWAHVYQLYLDGKQWWPDAAMDDLLAGINDYHTERSPVVDLLELTFEFNDSSEGEKYSMADIKNQMSKKQVGGSTTAIDLGNQTVSRQIKSYLSSKGVRETTARKWGLTLKAVDASVSIGQLKTQIFKDNLNLKALEKKEQAAKAA